jgi:hypothetical protein
MRLAQGITCDPFPEPRLVAVMDPTTAAAVLVRGDFVASAFLSASSVATHRGHHADASCQN